MDQDNRKEEWMIVAILFVLLIIAGTLYYFRIYFNESFLVVIKYLLYPVQYIPDYIINTLFFWKTPAFYDIILNPLHNLAYDFIPQKYSAFLISATTPQLITFNYPAGYICQDISPALNIFAHYHIENAVMGSHIAEGMQFKDIIEGYQNGNITTELKNTITSTCSSISDNYLMSPHSQLFSVSTFLTDSGYENKYGGLLNDLSKSNSVANYIGGLIWPYFFVFYFYIVLTYRKKRKYDEVHTADTILEQEKTVWHTIEPMLNVHPELEKDLEAGPWAMAKRAEHYGLDEKMIISNKNGFSLDFNRCESVFSKQCGRKFKGIPSFTIHERWLYAMFLTKANRNGKTANVMLDLLNDVHTSRTVSKSVIKATKKKLNTIVDQMLDKYADSDIEKMVFSEHYYTVCIMSRMLDEARQDGVLATSNFVWLRPLDRHLWYMMSNTGRGGIKKESGSASFVEVGGPTCHMISERLLKKKTAIPDVRQAIIAFDQYWFETNDKYTQYFKDEY